MPNKESAKKRLRQTAKKTLENKNRKTRIKTHIKRVEEAIVSGEQKVANTVLKEAQSEIMRGVSKGVLHKNTGANQKSRLSVALKKVLKEVV